MNVKRFLRVAALGIIFVIALFILTINVYAKSNLWMLEVSEKTAMAYNQLCVVDEDGHLYSLSGWVPAPMYKDKLCAAGIEVIDYAVFYEQKNYNRLVAYTEAPIPVVTDDAQIVHYYSTEESIVSFRKAKLAGYIDGHLTYDLEDSTKEYVFEAFVGDAGYSTYNLSDLEDGLYFVNLGGLVELKRSE